MAVGAKGMPRFAGRQHHQNSSLREKIVEHLLVGEILRELWRRGVTDTEILRSEYDGFGYDLVLSRSELVRHIQLKSSKGPKPKKVGIATSLETRPSGCVLVTCVDDHLNLGPFYWFGNEPGVPLVLPEKLPVLRRTTRNKEGVRPDRLNYRELPPRYFLRLDDIQDVIVRLMGPI